MPDVRQRQNIKETIHFCLERFWGRHVIFWRFGSQLHDKRLRHLALTSRALVEGV